MAAAEILAVLLLAASVFDLARQRIPNRLTLSGLLLGLLWHGLTTGWPGLAQSLEGLGIAGLTLLLWAARVLGAGDVKLLGVVGVWMGPVFLLWTLLGTIFAGGLLAVLVVCLRRSRKGRLPLAPAIALGATYAYCHLQLGTLF